MSHYLSGCMVGVFLLDENKDIVAQSLFPKAPEKIFKKMENLKKGKEIKEIKEVLKNFEGKEIITEFPLKLKEITVKIDKNNSGRLYLNKNLRKLAFEKGFVNDEEEFTELLSKYHIIKTRDKIKQSVKKDKVMAQAVSALRDLEDISNRFSERLREWYGLYFPELEKKIENNEKFAETIFEKPEREAHEVIKKSMGIDLEKNDIKILKKYAEETKRIYEIKTQISDYLENEMPSVAPNITHLVGPELAAQLILFAGSLEKLAKMPSSTIQLLGAEKALFRHMKGKGKPPKYGVLYKHPEIQNAQKNLRGKIARAIASKLMMAARTDFYTQKFKGEKYKEDLDEKIKQIKEEG